MAQGVSKSYRNGFRRARITALDGLDLSIEQGDAFGLLGPNGAGKTTFIKIALGVVWPDKGEVRLFERPCDDPAARRSVGYLPERLHIPDAWSAADFMRSVARLRALADPRVEIGRQLERVGLCADADRRVGGYSKGMRQRLGLAAALLGSPKLLVLDEPTDGMDPLWRREVRFILQQEVRRGAAVLLNSHLLAETELMCRRVGIIASGKLVRQGTLEELCAGTSGYLVRFAKMPADLSVPGWLASDDHSAVFEGSDPEALSAALAQLIGQGAVIFSVEPRQRRLEDILSELVGRPT
jgi:ABC-2 type transport system ATP-binding protein